MQNSLYISIIIVILIVLFHAFYLQYLEQNEILENHYGTADKIKIDNTDGLIWNLNLPIIKKIILIKENYTFDLYLKLFRNFKNVEISDKAIYHKIKEFNQLDKDINISYNIFNQRLSIKNHNHKKILILVYLIIKLSDNQISLKEIEKKQKINKLEKYSNSILWNKIKSLS